jgi:hypothetical protein
MQRKTKRQPDAFAAERRQAVSYTRPDKISASMFPLVRATHGNGLRSRERRFESCRGHCSKSTPRSGRSGSSSSKGWGSLRNSPRDSSSPGRSRSWPEPFAVPTSTSRTVLTRLCEVSHLLPVVSPDRGLRAAACWRADSLPISQRKRDLAVAPRCRSRAGNSREREPHKTREVTHFGNFPARVLEKPEATRITRVLSVRRA